MLLCIYPTAFSLPWLTDCLRRGHDLKTVYCIKTKNITQDRQPSWSQGFEGSILLQCQYTQADTRTCSSSSSCYSACVSCHQLIPVGWPPAGNVITHANTPCDKHVHMLWEDKVPATRHLQHDLIRYQKRRCQAWGKLCKSRLLCEAACLQISTLSIPKHR